MKKILSFFMMMVLFGIINAQINLPFQSNFSGLDGASATSGSSMPAMTAAKMPVGFLFASSTGLYQAGQKIKYGTSSAGGTLVSDVINTGSVSTIEVKFKAIAWPTAGAKTATINLTYGTQTKTITAAGRTDWPVNNTDLIEYSCQFDAIATPTSLSIATIANTSSNESRIFLDDVRIAPPTPITGIFLPFQSDFSALGGASTASTSSMPAMTAALMPEGFLFESSTGLYQGGQKIKYGTSSAGATLVSDVINTEGIPTIEVKLKAIAWPTTGAKTATINLTYGTQTKTVTAAGRTDWPVTHADLIEYSCQFDAIATPTSLSIATIANTSSNESRIFLDDVRIAAPSVVQVATPTFNIPTGLYTTTQNITISCTEPGATIHYTMGNNPPTPTTTDPTFTSTPISVSSTTTIKAIAVKVGMNNSSVASATYTFPIDVPNIAAFKTAHASLSPTGTATSTVPYRITGNVTFVEKLGRNIYIKDATGGLLIFDNTTPVVTNTYTNGDVISGGVIGTCTRYNSLFEMIPLFNPAAGTPGTPVTPIVKTMSDILANFSNYESQLMKVENIAFGEVKTLGLSSTAAGANVAILQGTDEMLMRNNYNTITGYETNPDSRFHVSGFIVPFNADRQICPRNFEDIEEAEYTIEVSANPTAGGNPTGGGTTFHYGDNITVQANPNAGYDFANWTEGGTVVSTSPNYNFDVTGSRILVANYLQKYTIAVSANPTIGGTVSGGGEYSQGASVSVSATAGTGYHFVNWTEGGVQVSTNNPYIFTATGNRTLVANFALNTYTITVSANPGVGGSATGGGSFIHGNSVSLSATANTGYHFVNWTENGTPVSTANPYTFDATSNRTLVANFTLNSYNIAVSANPPLGGTVGGGGTYNHFSTAAVTATPDIAYNFINWTEGGVQQSTNQNYSFAVTGPGTLVANFQMKTYNITSSAGNYGAISPVGIHPANYGSQPEYVITPNQGYHIQYIYIDGYAINYPINKESSLPYTYKFDPVYAPHTINVTFAQNCYALNPGNISGTGGTITMSPSGCVQHGQPVTFTITTDCSHITQILVNNTPITTQTPYSATYTINNVTEKLPLIVVTTLVDQYKITATPISDPNGAIVPSGEQFVDCGEDKTFQFEPEFGYRVKNLFINNISVTVPVTNSYTFKNVRANHTIHIEFEEHPQVIIQFGPSAAQEMGGRVFPTYKPSAVNYIAVDSGTVAYPFSIVPDDGYMIEYVYVDDVIQTNAAITGTYVFNNLHINHTIYATFKPIMFTITTTATGNGNLTPNGAVQVQHGANQTFMAVPSNGHYLTAVYVDGVYDDAATTASLHTFYDVTADHTISATFAPNPYTITATHGNGIYGTITPAGEIDVVHGGSQTFYFTPIEGYQIAQVLIDGIENPAAALAGFFTFVNITQGHTIEVTFTIKTFTITTTFSPGGNVYPAGIQYVDYNNHSPIFVFNPNPGYIVKQVIIDGVNDPLAVFNSEHRFLNVDANHTIYVVFAKDKYTITASATTGGAINPAGENIVATGTDKTFFFEPYAGHKLARVVINGVNNPEAVQTGFYTFVDVMDDHSIEAQFEKRMYNIILPDPNEGAVAVPVGGSNTPVEYGAQFNFVVAPLEGYTQSKFTVRANNIVIHAIGGIYTINNIATDQYVTVDGLALNTYTITAKANVGGTIKPAGIYQVKHGDSKTFEMVPNQGYKVSDVMVNGVSEGAVTSYTFHNVKANGTLNAYFKYCEVGINNNEKGLIRVFSQSNVITIENKDLVPIKQVEVIDMLGSALWRGQAIGNKTEITLKIAKGIYMVRVTTEEGRQNVTKVSIN